MAVKRTYKDSVFRKRFNSKKRLLELYNALENTDYGEEAEVEIITLDNAIYHGVRNDVSFTINGKHAVFIEHQASDPKNISLRSLLHVVSSYLEVFQLKELHERIITLPTPSFYLLYNGTTSYPEEHILKLSSAFQGGTKEHSLELKVKMININYGKSKLLERSKNLKDYAYFVYLIRDYQKEGFELEAAVSKAIDQCIEEGIMGDFLQKNRQAVLQMNCLGLALARSYDDYLEGLETKAIKKGLKEGLKEGIERGIEEGIEQGIEQGLERGKLESAVEIAKKLVSKGMSIEEVAEVSQISIEELKLVV